VFCSSRFECMMVDACLWGFWVQKYWVWEGLICVQKPRFVAVFAVERVRV
jgi:hypothetical protein